MKQILTLLILSVIVGCSSEIDKPNLIGKWAGFENDSSYSEVWFNDSLFLEWNADMYSHLVYSYQYDPADNKLIVMIPNDGDKINTIDVNFIDSGSIKLSDSKNSWTYRRIDSETPNLAEGRLDSIDFEIGMREKKSSR